MYGTGSLETCSIDDASVVPGAGAFEVAAAESLENYKHEVKGKSKLGVEAFTKALLVSLLVVVFACLPYLLFACNLSNALH